jgi:hypothetical protein
MVESDGMGDRSEASHWRCSDWKVVLLRLDSGGAIGTGTWDEVVRRRRCQKKTSEGTVELRD